MTDSATNIFNITSAMADISSSTISSTSTSALSSSPSVTTSNGEARSTTGSSPPAADRFTNEGMSTGAIVGIGIGVTTAVILLVGLAWYIGRRGAIKRQEMTQSAAKPVLPGHYVQPDRHCYTGAASGLNIGSPLAEAPPGDRRYELWSDREYGASVIH